MTLGDRVVVMKDGVIQQSAGALEIYHRPANRFVAGFLGSPPMNFFEGKLVREGDRLFFDEGTGKLPVGDWAKSELESRVGETVVLGARPEAMSDQQHARFPTSDNSLAMRVTLVQPLGDRMDVVLSTERHRHAVAQMPAHAGLRPGDGAPIFFDLERLHYFETGELGRSLVQHPGLPT
jgi:multiple sugar transport system ATP-binding protein